MIDAFAILQNRMKYFFTVDYLLPDGHFLLKEVSIKNN
jgi:hypothetical protein